jgi:hypothetical protein
MYAPLLLLEFRVRKTFAADVANLRGFSRKIGKNPRNLRQKGTWASQAKINSKLKLLQRKVDGYAGIPSTNFHEPSVNLRHLFAEGSWFYSWMVWTRRTLCCRLCAVILFCHFLHPTASNLHGY